MVYLIGSVFEVNQKQGTHLYRKGSPFGGAVESYDELQFYGPQSADSGHYRGLLFFRPRLPIRLNLTFLAILSIDFGTVLFDYVSNRLNETWQEHPPWLLWLFYLLFFLFYLTRIYMFFAFTISVLDARGGVRSRLYIYAPIFYFPCVALTFSSVFTHWVFRIENGYQVGPLSHLLYFCSTCYLLFSVVAILRRRSRLTLHETIGLLSVQIILITGNIFRAVLPHFMVMNTFSLMAILVIFLSFQNPDLFLTERGYVYNHPAFKALLLEWKRKNRPCRLLGFVLQNYGETREIVGGQQMDEAMTSINRYLTESFPHLCSFYLHKGCYVIAGSDRMDVDEVCSALEKRFADPWGTDTSKLVLNISFLRLFSTKYRMMPSTPADITSPTPTVSIMNGIGRSI